MTYSAPAPRGNLPLGIVLGVIVGAIAVMFVWFAVVDDPDRATPGQTPAPSATIEPTPSASASPSPSATPTPEASASATPEPTDNPNIVTELPAGTWVTVLASLPKGSVTAEQALERAGAESRNNHTAIVIDTDAFPGLTPGFWAVVVPGADSREASNQVCGDLGLAVNDKCYPRQIQG